MKLNFEHSYHYGCNIGIVNRFFLAGFMAERTHFQNYRQFLKNYVAIIPRKKFPSKDVFINCNTSTVKPTVLVVYFPHLHKNSLLLLLYPGNELQLKYKECRNMFNRFWWELFSHNPIRMEKLEVFRNHELKFGKSFIFFHDAQKYNHFYKSTLYFIRERKKYFFSLCLNPIQIPYWCMKTS